MQFSILLNIRSKLQNFTKILEMCMFIFKLWQNRFWYNGDLCNLIFHPSIILLPKRLCFISNQNIFLWMCMLVCPSWKLLYKNKQIKVLRFAWRCVCISTWINGHLYGTNIKCKKNVICNIFPHYVSPFIAKKCNFY